jgi:hypothetical protein
MAKRARPHDEHEAEPGSVRVFAWVCSDRLFYGAADLRPEKALRDRPVMYTQRCNDDIGVALRENTA